MIAVLGEVLIDVERRGRRRDRATDAIAVLRESATAEVPGGAGNVALNIARLGGNAGLWAPTGDDAGAIHSWLGAAGVECHFAAVPRWSTPRKERIFDGDLAVLRIDREELLPPHDWLGDRGWARARWIVCSDYGLGAWTEAHAREIAAAGVPVIADVRTPLRWWQGAAVWCPNEAEALAATGTATLDAALDAAREALPGTILAVTRGADGVAWDDGTRRDLPAGASPLVDAVGAGDTFAAALAVACAEGRDPLAAARWAIAAAGVAAARSGTHAVWRHEVAP